MYFTFAILCVFYVYFMCAAIGVIINKWIGDSSEPNVRRRWIFVIIRLLIAVPAIPSSGHCDCVITVQFSCSFDEGLNTKAVVVGAKITNAWRSRAEWPSCVCCKFWNITVGARLTVRRTSLRVGGFNKVSDRDSVDRSAEKSSASARFRVEKVCLRMRYNNVVHESVV